MVYYMSLLVIALLGLANAFSSENIDLVARSQSGELKQLGHYQTNEKKPFIINPQVDINDNEVYCVGIKGIEDKSCSIVKDVTKHKYDIQLDSKGDFVGITINSGDWQHSQLKTPTKAPSPNLHPNNIAKGKSATSSNEKIKPEGEENKESEEDTRSWVQKNWTYIVPPLIILFVLFGDEENQKRVNKQR